MSLEYNEYNVKLCKSIESLPKNDNMIDFYIHILNDTNNAVIRGEIAYLLSQLCPSNSYAKQAILNCINSPKTNGAKGSLLYALQHFDYSDIDCIDMLCNQLYSGNYECMYRAYHMLLDVLPKLDKEKSTFVKNEVLKNHEMLVERLELFDGLLDNLE